MTNNSIMVEVFNFNQKQVRIQLLNNEPYFCLKDVCMILEIQNVQANRFNLDSRGVHKMSTPTYNQHGTEVNQKLIFINEPNLYRLIFRSNKKDAKQFQDFIFNKVLPEIRKTGSYNSNSELSRKDLALIIIKQEEEKERLQLENKELKPKAEFHDRTIDLHGSLTVGQAAKSLGTGRTRLMEFLRKNKWITRRNEPYQEKIEQGLLDVKLSNWEHPEKGIQEVITTLITGKGLTKLFSLFSVNASKTHV